MKKVLVSTAFMAVMSLFCYGQEEINSLRLLSKADMLIFNGQNDDAANILKQLLSKDPENKYLNFQIGLTLAGKSADSYNNFLKAYSVTASNLDQNPVFITIGQKSNFTDTTTGFKPFNSFTGFKFDLKKPYNNICISKDFTRIVFIDLTSSENKIYFIQRKGNEWLSPIDITSQLGSSGEFFPSSFSADGKRLYFTRFDAYGGSIYVSTFDGKAWQTLKKLNSNINSGYSDTHPYETEDGVYLYFASSRPGGFGGLDIYFSIKINGDWSKATNLGAVINSNFDEDYPALVNKDNCLLFSTMAITKGKDKAEICKAYRIDDTQWSEPVSLSFPFNTSEDDYSYNPLNLYSRNFLYNNILRKESANIKQPFTVLFETKVLTNKQPASKFSIFINSLSDKTFSKVTETNSNGIATFNLPEGIYHLSCKGTNAAEKNMNIIVPSIFKNDTAFINIEIAGSPKKDSIPTNIWKQ